MQTIYIIQIFYNFLLLAALSFFVTCSSSKLYNSNGLYVVYMADQGTSGVMELYAVP